MGTFRRKRRGRPVGPWWVRFRIGGKAVVRSAHTFDRQKAEEYEQALRARYWRQVKLGEDVHTWAEAVAKLKEESRWTKNTRENNDRAFDLFAVINHIPVTAIDKKVIDAARQRAMLMGADGRKLEHPRAPGSVRRLLAVFSQVLNACEEWGWLTHAPKVKMPSLIERDPNYLLPDQCPRLLQELPEHLRGPFLCSILAGMRMSNTRDLKWSQIDLENGLITIPSSHYKAKRNTSLPISPALRALLDAVPRYEGIEHVFTYRPKVKSAGKPVAGETREPRFGAPRPIAGTFNTKAFRKARKRAGVTVRWHDLRHTFASWLALQNASDRVLQAMCGWTSPAMAHRYAHLRAGDLRSWAVAVGANAVTSLAAAGVVIDAEKPINPVVPAVGIEPTTPSLRKLKVIEGGK